MELESLKYVWHSMELRPSLQREEEPITRVLQKRSRGAVGKMRRNLLGEVILILTAYTPAIGYYLFGFDGRFAEIGGLLAVLLIFFAGYFYRKYQLLGQMQCPGCQVRSNLERQVDRLEKYTRFYVLAGTIMIPVIVLLSLLIIHSRLPHSPGEALYYQLNGSPWWRSPFVWVSALGGITCAAYFINVWYVNRLYGRHIAKLRQILNELNEE